MQNTKRCSIIITGSHGFTGSVITTSLLKVKDLDVIVPSKRQLDITNQESVAKFLRQTKPEIIINFASFTNIEEAEKQRNNIDALVWKTNVIGVINLAKICKKLHIFLIHVSSDAIFPGTQDFPGPYAEQTTAPNNSKNLTWYAYTKLKGEQGLSKIKADSAIIRISYPFGNLESSKDFSVKTERYIRQGIELFFDQYLTPTYLPDLYLALIEIINKKFNGVFHVACRNITTPYKFALYVSEKINFDNRQIKKGSIHNYHISKKSLRRSQFGGLETTWTQKKLRVNFHGWKRAIDKLYAQK